MSYEEHFAYLPSLDVVFQAPETPPVLWAWLWMHGAEPAPRRCGGYRIASGSLVRRMARAARPVAE